MRYHNDRYLHYANNDNTLNVSNETTDIRTFKCGIDILLATYPNADTYMWHFDYYGKDLTTYGKTANERWLKLRDKIHNEMKRRY